MRPLRTALHRSLAVTMLLAICAAYLVLALATTYLQLRSEYHRLRAEAQQRIVMLEDTFGPGLASAVWTYNDQLMAAIVTGMERIPLVAWVELRDRDGHLLRPLPPAAAAPPVPVPWYLPALANASGQHAFALRLTDLEGTPRNVGHCTIHIDNGAILARIHESFRLILSNLALWSIGLLAIIFLIVQHMLGRPLERLAAAVAGTSRQLASIDTGLRTENELKLLERAFNQMLLRMRSFNEELERAVARRTAELEVANRELDAFAYSVSHDLRAPLRAVDGFSQAVLEDYDDQLDEQGRVYLHKLREGSQEMGRLIDGILTLSRSSRGELLAMPVDLSALAEEVMAGLQRAEPERRVTWRIAPGLHANGDPRLLRVVLGNLLGNAWKFTAKAENGATITMDRETRAGETVFRVRDNGAGFDMAYADDLFRPFKRLHRAADFPGTGIGLATVQRIIHRHGGRIWAEGREGAGATFHFTLGAGTATGATEAPVKVKHK